MKLLTDLFPVIVFFAVFKLYGIYYATAAAIAGSAVQVGFLWLRHRRVERMHLATLGIIVVLGGATLLLQEEIFIKWKPTVVYWLFAAVFLASHVIGSRRPLLQRLMQERIQLPAPVWQRLSLGWTLFFIALGLINLYVVYHFDTDTWVDFKLFGVTGLTFAFVILQAIYMVRHMKIEESSEES